MSNFLTSGQKPQETKISKIHQVSQEIYGDENQYSLPQFLKRNENFLNSFHLNLNMLIEKIRMEEDKVSTVQS